MWQYLLAAVPPPAILKVRAYIMFEQLSHPHDNWANSFDNDVEMLFERPR